MVVLPGVSPPLPIPNRVVKPPMANGTAPQCGRVGSRHILLSKTLVPKTRVFLCPALPRGLLCGCLRTVRELFFPLITQTAAECADRGRARDSSGKLARHGGPFS